MKHKPKRSHARWRAETTAERAQREREKTLQRALRIERRIAALTRQLRGATILSDRARRDLVFDLALREGLVLTPAEEAAAADQRTAEDEFTRPVEIEVDTIEADG